MCLPLQTSPSSVVERDDGPHARQRATAAQGHPPVANASRLRVVMGSHGALADDCVARKIVECRDV